MELQDMIQREVGYLIHRWVKGYSTSPAPQIKTKTGKAVLKDIERLMVRFVSKAKGIAFDKLAVDNSVIIKTGPHSSDSFWTWVKCEEMRVNFCVFHRFQEGVVIDHELAFDK